NIDVSPPKGGLKSSAAIAMTVLLIFGAVAGVMVFPAKSAFAATITSSSPTFYGPAMERFLIEDSSKDTTGDTITVHVKAARGATSLFEQDVTLCNIGSSGQFELFVTTANSPTVPANPTFTSGGACPSGIDNPFIVRISSTAAAANANEKAFL